MGLRLVKRPVTIRMAVEGNMVEVHVEERLDPVTGTWSRVGPHRAARETWGQREAQGTGRAACPFCSPTLYRATPLPQIFVGGSAAVPNRYPFARAHYVVVPRTSAHVTDLSQLDLDDVVNAFEAARRVGGKYLYVNMNLGPHAGASQPHVHLQVFASERPTNAHRAMILRGRAFRERTGVDILRALLDLELEVGERYLGRFGDAEWTAAFAPVANGEVIGVVEGPNYVEGVWRVLRALSSAYPGHGINMAVFPPHRHLSGHVRAVLRLPTHTSDVGFMELLHREPVIVVNPELHAGLLRRYLA